MTGGPEFDARLHVLERELERMAKIVHGLRSLVHGSDAASDVGLKGQLRQIDDRLSRIEAAFLKAVSRVEKAFWVLGPALVLATVAWVARVISAVVKNHPNLLP